MINKITWYGTVEEFPMNMWDVEVTDWVIGKLVLLRKVFYKTCYGMDSRMAKPHNEWSRSGAGIVERGTWGCPKGCLWVSGQREKQI